MVLITSLAPTDMGTDVAAGPAIDGSGSHHRSGGFDGEVSGAQPRSP